jgi:hypothetical protein
MRYRSTIADKFKHVLPWFSASGIFRLKQPGQCGVGWPVKFSRYSCRLDQDTARYIDLLSMCLDLRRSDVVRELLRVAVGLHRGGAFELPSC